MSQLWFTLILTFFLVFLALMGLAIGWFFKGRTKLHTCANARHGKKCEHSNPSCPVCRPEKRD